MRIRRNRERLLLYVFGVGFLIGIIYENIVYRSYNHSTILFQDYLLEQFSETELVTADYLKYIVQARVIPLLCLCLLSCVKWKKTFVSIIIGWTGFLLGVFTVLAIIWHGILGVLICIALLFPHMIFYGLSYTLLLWYFYAYPEYAWNLKRTIVMCVSMAMGVILEIYISPWIIGAALKLL